MAERSSTPSHSITVGDAAVDGLFGGLLAGVIMVVFLVLAGLSTGTETGETLTFFDAAQESSALVGSVVHLAVSGVYGLVFGILYHMVVKRVPGWLAGLVYGLILFTGARVLLLPASGSALMEIPFWQFGVAHLAYGLILGVTTDR